jgi:hypothetical protein
MALAASGAEVLGATIGMLVLVVALVVLRRIAASRRSERRAEAVLRRHLSSEELAHLKRSGVLEVASRALPGRVYEVRARSGRVLVRDGGVRVMELCVRCATWLPGNEHVVAHKVMIQAAEAEYLARANLVWRRGQATVCGRESWFD